MIYVTGDTHGEFFKLETFAKQNNSKLTRDDYVIVAGDFGFLWFPDEKDDNILRLSKLPFTILFVDGNHENFDMLEAYPIEEWKGGKVHRISENVIHLMRGQIFDIDGKTILAFGGAESTDKHLREEGVSWWKQEEIIQVDVDEAITNLDIHLRSVDYVISHSCSANLKQCYAYIFAKYGIGLSCYSEQLLIGAVENYIDQYKHWYFGHFHFDGSLGGKHTAVYERILKLD